MNPLITGLICIAAVGAFAAGMLAKAEMDTLDQNGDPIDQEEQP